MNIVASSAPSIGHCNTMGTASTMNSLAEALGMSLPGCAAIPAPYRERGQIAYETGTRIVGMVWEDLKPSDILTRKAFENCIVVNSAIGGSTNAPIHINALARHIGVELSIDDWQKHGHDVPLMVNMQPAGFYLGEEYHRAGGVPAVVRELMAHKRIHEDAMTVNGHTMGDNCREAPKPDGDVIWSYDKPLVKDAGFLVLRGNLFDSAIMKTSVISKEFRDRYLINPKDLNAFEGRAIVFEGPEDYHHRIDDAALNIDEHCILFVRGTGPIGYPGGAEVVNMQPPAALIKRGILSLPCIGDGRQSGTSGLAVDPQCHAGSRRRWRAGNPAHRRHGAHRSEQGQRQHPDFGGRGEAAPRQAESRRRIQISRQPDALAGALPFHGRPAGHRRLHGARDALPRHRRHRRHGAGQSLVPCAPRHPTIVVPANAGTHSHRPRRYKRPLTHCPNETPRRMGPCVSRDDSSRVPDKPHKEENHVRSSQGKARRCHRSGRGHRTRLRHRIRPRGRHGDRHRYQ